MNTLLIWLATCLLKKGVRSLILIFAIVMAVSLSIRPLPAHAEEGGNDHCAAPPISTITSPLAGAQIGGVTTYTITGTASSAGTGVLKVKVSTNGGKNWHLATDTSGNASWTTWSFTWKMISNKADNYGDIDPDEKNVLKDGSYVIKSRAKSHSGCVETAGPGVTVTVDNTEPVTAASAAGYVFGSLTATSPVSVILSASDGAGSGVAAGYPKYCVDTANTCAPNLAYSSAINVTCAPGSTCTQYVRYYSLDRAGNSEVVQSSMVKQNVLDLLAPVTTASPAGGRSGNLQTVTLSCDDGAGSGCARIYYTTDGSTPTTNSAVYAGPISISKTSTVSFFAVDHAGNSEAVKSIAYIITYHVTTDAGAHGSISCGPVTVDYNANSLCTITPDAGYHIAGVSAGLTGGALNPVGAVTSYLLANVTADMTIAAAFAINTFTVTPSAGPGGSISPSTPRTVDYNGAALFSVTPDTGHHLVAVTGCNGTLSGNTYTTGAISGDCTVSAAFAIDTFTITMNTGTHGSASCDPTMVTYNAASTCVITPDAGYHASVTGCNGTLSGNTFTTGAITSDCTVSAVFVIDTFTVTPMAGAGGSFAPNAPLTVNYHGTATLTAVPDAGNHATITGCGGTQSGNTFTITAVKENCTVFATFANGAPSMPEIDFPLPASQTGLTPSLEVKASTDPDGDALTYTFEIYSDPELSEGARVAQAATTSASWVVPSAALADNTMYYWRAKAADGYLSSDWMPTANFFVNTANDNPTTPNISSPQDGVQVTTLAPALSVTNASDVDFYDALSYDFDVATDAGFTNIVARTSGIAKGAGGATSWIVMPALSENSLYYWRARAKDANGGESVWVSASFFVNTANDSPTAPVIKTPSDGGEVATFTPTLVMNNATDLDSHFLMYTFELDTVNTFDSLNKQASGLIAEGADTTAWTPAALTENTTYYWRAKAGDGQADSPWVTASFFVNTVNEAPSVPTLHGPANNSWVTVLAPSLQVNASIDPDNDGVTYAYEVYSDSALTSRVMAFSGAGTSWTINRNLIDNTWYWWRAQAKDEHGAVSGWTTASSFFVNDKGYNDPPGITIIKPGASDSTNAAGYTIAWTASDPDSDPVVTLFYDTTGSGFSGVQIATGMRLSDPVSSYVWDISGLGGGTYYVYAKIDDGTTAVYAYSGPLTIVRVPTYDVTATAEATGSITPSGTIRVNQGDSLTFKVTPNAGYVVRSFWVNGAPKTLSPDGVYTLSNIQASATVQAFFKVIPYTITSAVVPANSGKITSQGVNALGTYTYYIYSPDKTYDLAPNAGYHLLDVLVDGVSRGLVTSYTFVNDQANHTITALYEQNQPYIIAAHAGPNGSLSPSGDVSVIGGTNQTFTFTAAAGYRVLDVLVDGTSAGAMNSYTFVNVQAGHTISATFTPDVYTITAAADVNGSIEPSGALTVNKGASQTYTITPADGYQVSFVIVDNAQKGAITTYTFANIAANHTINAYFKVKTYNIIASAGAGGNITPSGTVMRNIGTDQTYTITPSPGYHIADVAVDGLSQGAVATYTFASLSADHSITVTFAPNPSYTLIASAGPNGSISPTGEISALGGTSRTFVINPDAGYRVADVTVDGASQGAVTAYSFTNIAANHAISATFTLIQYYNITAGAGPNGSISPSGTVSVPEFTNKTYTITPAPGYRVMDVLVDGASVGAKTSYTFANVQAVHTISATFTPDVYTVTASADVSGGIAPAGTITVNKGDSLTFTITPDAGYEVQSVIVDGANKGAVTTYTFANIAANHTISAYFKIITYTITAATDANGTISPAGVIFVNLGAGKTYTITPKPGYHTADVLVDGTSVGAVGTYVFTNVTSSHTITATFAENPAYTITAPDDMDFAGMHGSISPAGISSVLGGTNKRFDITPDAGYRVDDVLVDGVSVGAVTSYTFFDIQKNHTISATFTSDVYTITATAGVNGNITPAGAITVNKGDSLTFTVTPDAGYTVFSVIVDGANKGAVAAYTFTNVTANHTINAYFQ